jgi:hypothetical protein
MLRVFGTIQPSRIIYFSAQAMVNMLRRLDAAMLLLSLSTESVCRATHSESAYKI